MKRTLAALVIIFVISLSGSAATRSLNISSGVVEQPQIQHVILIMLENKIDQEIVNNSEVPYENQLIKDYAFASNFSAVSQQGLIDYLALLDGSNDMNNISPYCNPNECNYSGSNLFYLLDQANPKLSWKGYDEWMNGTCEYLGYPLKMPNGNVDEYWPIHNAIPYFTDIRKECLNYDVPFGFINNDTGPFFTDLASPNFANFTTISPDVCNDMNTCPGGLTEEIQDGDLWLSELVPIIESSQYNSSTVIFITFDNAGDQGQPLTLPIPMTVVGPRDLVTPGNYPEPYSDYSFLATMESIFHLPSLGLNDTTALPMFAILPSMGLCSSGSTCSSTTSTTTTTTKTTTSRPNTTTTTTTSRSSTSKNTGSGLPFYLVGGAAAAAVAIVGGGLFLRRRRY